MPSAEWLAANVLRTGCREHISGKWGAIAGEGKSDVRAGAPWRRSGRCVVPSSAPFVHVDEVGLAVQSREALQPCHRASGHAGGQLYAAAALSLVFHPLHPMVPTLRADVRRFEVRLDGVDSSAEFSGCPVRVHGVAEVLFYTRFGMQGSSACSHGVQGVSHQAQRRSGIQPPPMSMPHVNICANILMPRNCTE